MCRLSHPKLLGTGTGSWTKRILREQTVARHPIQAPIVGRLSVKNRIAPSASQLELRACGGRGLEFVLRQVLAFEDSIGPKARIVKAGLS